MVTSRELVAKTRCGKNELVNRLNCCALSFVKMHSKQARIKKEPNYSIVVSVLHFGERFLSKPGSMSPRCEKLLNIMLSVSLITLEHQRTSQYTSCDTIHVHPR